MRNENWASLGYFSRVVGTMTSKNLATPVATLLFTPLIHDMALLLFSKNISARRSILCVEVSF